MFAVTIECRRLGLRAGAILFRDLTVSEAKPELRQAVAREAEKLRQRFDAAATIRAIPEVQGFQALLRQVGANPRREQPSVERLLHYALKRGTLPAINSLVDVYNLVSVQRLCSVGAHDLDRITPPISLQILTGSEAFTPLGSAAAEPVRPGEFGYVDGAGRVLCRLDVRQAEFSKVTSQTRNAVLIVEGTAAHSSVQLAAACTEAISAITHYCGGTAETLVVP